MRSILVLAPLATMVTAALGGAIVPRKLLQVPNPTAGQKMAYISCRPSIESCCNSNAGSNFMGPVAPRKSLSPTQQCAEELGLQLVYPDLSRVPFKDVYDQSTDSYRVPLMPEIFAVFAYCCSEYPYLQSRETLCARAVTLEAKKSETIQVSKTSSKTDDGFIEKPEVTEVDVHLGPDAEKIRPHLCSDPAISHPQYGYIHYEKAFGVGNPLWKKEHFQRFKEAQTPTRKPGVQEH